METPTEINAALESMGISLKYCKLHVASTVIPGTDITGLRYDNSLRCDVTLTVTRGKPVPPEKDSRYTSERDRYTSERENIAMITGKAPVPCPPPSPVTFYEGEYRMGLAHISLFNGAFFPDHAEAGRIIGRTTSHRPLSTNDIARLNSVVFTSRQRGPVLADAMRCVLLDGTAALAETFESWCRNFSCSTDSRHAYETYNRSVQDGIRFRQVLTGDEMAKLAELFANY